MHKILVVAANPKDNTPLRLGQEVRDIQEGLRRSRHRDQFEFVSEWAVGPRELRRALLDHQPEFVHFSGHGTEEGIALENESGVTHIVGVDALAELFSHFADHVHCVLLNACHSQLQAEAISRVIPYAIGMQGKISDEAAVEFSVGFYDAIGAGREIDDAFAIGCSAIHTAGLPGHLLPVLNRHRVDAPPGLTLDALNHPSQPNLPYSEVKFIRVDKKPVSMREFGDVKISINGERIGVLSGFSVLKTKVDTREPVEIKAECFLEYKTYHPRVGPEWAGTRIHEAILKEVRVTGPLAILVGYTKEANSWFGKLIGGYYVLTMQTDADPVAQSEFNSRDLPRVRQDAYS